MNRPTRLVLKYFLLELEREEASLGELVAEWEAAAGGQALAGFAEQLREDTFAWHVSREDTLENAVLRPVLLRVDWHLLAAEVFARAKAGQIWV